ncbi:radical SAM protein [Chitinophaga polysaccharea]|uniref:radical SAM/SPASM domain-containing protein n=1 Tax=Chitinophaga TaxID=79328 RepID=UPI001455AE30|nr:MULTISPECIES: radical SAM protein [Chitinophaga]NLR62481.1 radical SAM protein [Chitinophaga polysaccharea]NLU92349.1 radical SAM protein [Chitinophaga sp. Ak27]
MKFSQFNSIIPYSGKFALYNAFAQKVIFLDTDLKDILQAAIHEGVDELQHVHPSFYEYLVKKAFLVDNDVDEIEKVKQLSKSIDENPDSFILTINPSMNCNFKCWYCYETHVKNSRLTPEMIDRINAFITQTANQEGMNYFQLAFFGGEPLLYFQKEVVPLIDTYIRECRKNNLQTGISFTTNGYLINQEFIDYFNNNNISCTLQITLDGYKEKHDLVRFVSANKGSYDKIIENVKLLISNKFFVRLRINYTDMNIEGSHLIAQEFDSIPYELRQQFLMMDYHRVWQNDAIDNTFLVLDNNVGKIQEMGVKVSSKYSPNSVRESCYADKRNSAVINYNGDLFKCTARDFTTAKRAGYLDSDGTLVWENDYLERRMNIKFKNKPCLSCKIMPLCNGGCSQHAMEHFESGSEYCVHSGDENEKMRIIKTKVDEIVNRVSAEKV